MRDADNSKKLASKLSERVSKDGMRLTGRPRRRCGLASAHFCSGRRRDAAVTRVRASFERTGGRQARRRDARRRDARRRDETKTFRVSPTRESSRLSATSIVETSAPPFECGKASSSFYLRVDICSLLLVIYPRVE